MDSYIKTAIEQLNENLSAELSKIDGEIMRTIAEMRQLELKLETISAFDYRAILLPLVKVFLRFAMIFIVDMAHKDAMEECDAAIKAFFADLAFDSRSAKH
ncbi:hypothetical protein K1719_015416 [Acacia pycnantha]|nr:hypothetical protein K1719_015416 [Acacia pycnantha]